MLGDRPQSTPISSPILQPTTHRIDIPSMKKMITPTTSEDYSSFTKVTPIRTKSRKYLPEEEEDEDQVEIVIEPLKDDCQMNQFVRPPPLLVLSQRIRLKHPDQITDQLLIDPFPSIEDLPTSPANYSFVFYQFTPM